MTTWIFQANPETFQIDEYLKGPGEIRWTVNQKHLAGRMAVRDRVFVWRSDGQKKGSGGVIASGHLTSVPTVEAEDPRAIPLWTSPPAIQGLRVRLNIIKTADGHGRLSRKALQSDPVLRDLTILKLAQLTNYEVPVAQAERLEQLWQETGSNWTEAESTAALWAYAKTYGHSLSPNVPGSPITEVAVRIGRGVPSVYTKVINFRALDPRDERKGLNAASMIDLQIWDRYFDDLSSTLDEIRLERDYRRLWQDRPAARSDEPLAHEGSPSPQVPPERRQTDQGQGLEPDPLVRKAIELHAMTLATLRYKSQGFEVEDTSNRNPYDLRCVKGELEVRVEVKGTRGDGSSVEVTIGEVENARSTVWRTDIFVVSEIHVEAGPPPTASGGLQRQVAGWRPEDKDLSPTRFRYRLPV